MAGVTKPIGEPKAGDFAGLAILSLFWGSAFFFTEIALEAFAPFTVAAGRIVIAAIFLTAVARLSGAPLPRDRRTWAVLFAAGLSGAAAPFSLIAFGQSIIPSSTAAILMAFTPLSTAVLAHFMTRDEKLTAGKLAGVLTGLAGVAILVSGLSFAGLAAGGVVGKLAVVLGTVGYALSSILLRRVAHLPTLVSAAGVMITAAATIAPIALAVERPWTATPGWREMAALLELGLFPSAVAVIVMVWVLGRSGATFVSLNNYLAPVVGTVLGVAFLGETLERSMILGFVLIAAGVLITQHAQRRQVMGRRRAASSP